MQVKHAFTSAKADGPDSTRLRPSNWNADHLVTVSAGGVVLGRAAGAGAGAVGEIPFAQLLPFGVILPFGGSAAPGGWLFPFGQLVNRVTYALLFAAIGTTFGAGDGVTTFRLPDMRGVVPAGKSDMGGADRGNLGGGGVLGNQSGTQSTSASVSVSVSGGIGGSTFGSIGVVASGQTGGPDSVLSRGDQGGGTPVASETHTHSVTVSGSTSGALGVTGTFSGSGGSGTSAITTVQPTIVLNYIINTGV